jgi:hypothetical protein
MTDTDDKTAAAERKLGKQFAELILKSQLYHRKKLVTLGSGALSLLAALVLAGVVSQVVPSDMLSLAALILALAAGGTG